MIVDYFKDIKNEFFKIKWLTFKEVISTSVSVFLIIVAFSFIFLTFDIFSLEIIKKVFNFN